MTELKQYQKELLEEWNKRDQQAEEEEDLERLEAEAREDLEIERKRQDLEDLLLEDYEAD